MRETPKNGCNLFIYERVANSKSRDGECFEKYFLTYLDLKELSQGYLVSSFLLIERTHWLWFT